MHVPTANIFDQQVKVQVLTLHQGQGAPFAIFRSKKHVRATRGWLSFKQQLRRDPNKENIHWHSYLEDSSYGDRKQEIFLTQQQQQAVSVFAKKQAVFNNVEEQDVHGTCILQPVFSVDNCTFKLTTVSTRSRVPAALPAESRHIFFPECRLCGNRAEAGR